MSKDQVSWLVSITPPWLLIAVAKERHELPCRTSQAAARQASGSWVELELTDFQSKFALETAGDNQHIADLNKHNVGMMGYLGDTS